MGRQNRRQQLISLLGQMSLKDVTSIEELQALHDVMEKLKANEPEKKARKPRTPKAEKAEKPAKEEKVKSRPLTGVIPSAESKAKIEAAKAPVEEEDVFSGDSSL